MFISLFLLLACGDKEGTFQCTEEILEECDAEGVCAEVEDCAAVGQICHDMGADSHCMNEGMMDDEDDLDSGTDM